MVEHVRLHAADQADVVGDRPDVRQHFRHLHAGLAVADKLSFRAEQLRVLFNEGEPFSLDVRLRNDLPRQFTQLRFVIIELQVARSAGHEEVNNVLRASGKMPITRREWIRCSRIIRCLSQIQPAIAQQRSEPEPTDREPGIRKKVSSSLLANEQFLIRHGDSLKRCFTRFLRAGSSLPNRVEYTGARPEHHRDAPTVPSPKGRRDGLLSPGKFPTGIENRLKTVCEDGSARIDLRRLLPVASQGEAVLAS